MVIVKGDTERQAILRDKIIKASKRKKRSNYVLKISAVIKSGMKLLDIGCGTAHIIEDLALHHENVIFVGLDVSPAMLKIAKSNTKKLSNVMLVEGDGLKLPFSECSFDIAITRLAEYSSEEVYRVLKRGGFFFEYGLGPEANREIMEFFPGRIEEENFFFPKNVENWKREVCEKVANAGLFIESINDYKERNYYQSVDELMNLIEMVPLVKDFDRVRDKEVVEKLAEKYWEKRGIGITWHYYILTARRL